MAQRLFRTVVFVMLTIALLGPSPSRADDPSERRPTIAFGSTRDFPSGTPFAVAIEIYLMNPTADPTRQDVRRLTHNTDGDLFANPSPDGKKIVFDSNRGRTPTEPVNTSDLFLMKMDGSDQTFLTRGSSASWSPDSQQVAFHASASGTGVPMKNDPGAATSDSDIFVINVGDCLDDAVACQNPTGSIKRNLTNNNATCDDGAPYDVEDDVDWSPDGKQIVFTSHLCNDIGDDSETAEIYVMNADGTGRTPLTNNGEEERGPDWSPDGSRIVFMCRPDRINENEPRFFQICVMDADPTTNDRTQLTFDTNEGDNAFHATPVWLTETTIAFDKNEEGKGPGTRELFTMNADGTGQTRLTDIRVGINGYANYGVVRIPGHGQSPVAAGSTDRSADTVRGPAVHDGKADHGKQDKDTKHKKHKQDDKHKKHKSGKRHR
jgi:TolB protein